MRTISSSIALSTRGRPGLRCFEPSNLRATSLRYHPRMVSGRAAVATSPSALRPSRRPISPSFARSASESFGRPFNWSLRIRFSAARYSCRSSSSWSTVPIDLRASPMRRRTVRIGLLFNPATAVRLQYTLPSIQAAASSLAVQVNAAPVHAKDEIEGVIAAQTRDPGGGLIVMPDVFNDVNRELIIASAARYSVPTIYFNRFFSEPGGLISYGDVRSEQFRLAAGYIDRVLKGEKPADLPVQVPTKYELIINLKTAKALGLTISDKLFTAADEVIE